jgi:Transglycosylase SLT domain
MQVGRRALAPGRRSRRRVLDGRIPVTVGLPVFVGVSFGDGEPFRLHGASCNCPSTSVVQRSRGCAAVGFPPSVLLSARPAQHMHAHRAKRHVRTLPALAVSAVLALGMPAALTADTAYTARSTLTVAATPQAAGQPPAVLSSAFPSAAVPRHTGTMTGPGTPPRRLLVPDLVVIIPAGITSGQVTAISAIRGVRAVLATGGGQVRIDGQAAAVLGVSAQAFRQWTPPVTAAATGVWASLAAGNLVAAPSAVARLGLKLGDSYPVDGTASLRVPFTATAPIGIPGIDAILTGGVSARLGLTANVAVLVDAPGVNFTVLSNAIKSVTGTSASVVNLIPAAAGSTLPVTSAATVGRPANYLQLYQDAAARYCPGLSWTVLAAIGEIESGDGANDGPSSAGALGPMQFMPATWAEWGLDGYGPPGTPDISNPFDAVPSAARMLCADGAAVSSKGLFAAIYDYNHATWYVHEVLDLAAEYAQEYR